MADPTGAIALEATEIFEMEHNKERTDANAVLSLENSPSGAYSGDVSDPDPLAHLPEHFRKEIEAQAQVVSRKVSFKELFRFAGRQEKSLMLLGTVMAIGSGAAFPLMTVIFGSLITAFTNFAHVNAEGQPDPLITPEEFQSKVNSLSLAFVYLFIGAFVATYIKNTCWMLSGARIARSVRQAYLKAILRQNIAYFDKLGAGEVTTRITTDTNLLQDGISVKVALTIHAIAMFFVAFIIAFVKQWKMTLVLICIIPALGLPIIVTTTIMQKHEKRSLDHYAEGATLAEEVISTVRVAHAFGTQERLVQKYDDHLVQAEKSGAVKSIVIAIQMFSIFFVIYSAEGLAFWYGATLIVNGTITNPGVVITVFFAVLIGAFSVGEIAPNLQAFTLALSACAKIYETIDRVPKIDIYSDEGECPKQVDGVLEFRNVNFIYPSRPEVQVLENVNLLVPHGKTTALVGASGSGKSTIVGLAERWYDPVEGEVLLDGLDLRSLNLRWLRNQISLVSQEPTLFNATIFENVCHGLIGSKWEHAEEDEKRKLAQEACIVANADNFIQSLPDKYDTVVGERAVLLSGGQKQRIAIARAVVSDPKILLLDEATSALDSQAEGIVQNALDKAAMNRTTIIIAHRLSTIKNAENIVVMAKGKIIEQGTHNELLALNAAYAKFVTAQALATKTIEEGKGRDEIETDGVESSGPSFDEKDDIIPNLNRLKSGRSVASQELERQDATTTKDRSYSLFECIRRVFYLQKDMWLVLGIAAIACVVGGAVYPAQAIVFAYLVDTFSLTGQALQTRADFWALMFFVIAISSGIAYLVIGYVMTWTSERLTRRLRYMYFRYTLRQDIVYFDQDGHTTGALTSALSLDPTQVQQLVGTNFGLMLIVLVNLVGGMIVALAYGWKMALVVIFGGVPFIFAGGAIRMRLLLRFHERTKKAYESSANFACEATGSIRTVASLTREADVMRIYERSLDAPSHAQFRMAVFSNIWFGLAETIMFLTMALAFWYGSTLVRIGEYSLTQMFTVFIAMIFGSQSAGQFFSFTPDITKAKTSTANLLTLFDRIPKIDFWSEKGEDVTKIEGDVEFKDVHFRYATRKHVPVLRGLDLRIKPGQYAALVGISGSGKSTIVSLIERFYDVLSGQVLVDGKDISTFNIRSYRQHIALVSQEPTLYQGSIRENVVLGAASKDATLAEVEAACRQANIHDFIASLPQGYETDCGAKGVQLSGGQKQRIAIARALIRNPKILLLDEATSALDSSSEKVVQEALDQAAKGRTTIAVAHRLSTIQKADIIYVLDQGVVYYTYLMTETDFSAESGTHDELYALKGRYFEMVQAQALEATE